MTFKYTCHTCKRVIDYPNTEKLWSDASALEMVHGGGYQCKECYAKDGHKFCTKCGDRALKIKWKYCPDCGTRVI